MDAPLPFSRWLKQLRADQDLTQETLAEQVGCSPEMIRAIEGARRRPSRAMAERFAEVFAMAPEQRSAFLLAARAVNVGQGDAAPTLPSKAPSQPAARLVVPPTVLIGRAMELDAVCRRLIDPTCRLVTVLGPGGMGKTRLAVQVVDALRAQFADGVVVVALAPLSAPEQVVTAIAAACGCSYACPCPRGYAAGLPALARPAARAGQHGTCARGDGTACSDSARSAPGARAGDIA